jgi:hypothetical protein
MGKDGSILADASCFVRWLGEILEIDISSLLRPFFPRGPTEFFLDLLRMVLKGTSRGIRPSFLRSLRTISLGFLSLPTI